MNLFQNMTQAKQKKQGRKQKKIKTKSKKVNQIDRMTTMMAKYSGCCLSQSQIVRNGWNSPDEVSGDMQTEKRR